MIWTSRSNAISRISRQGKSPNMTTACQSRVQIACSFSAQEALRTKPGIFLQFPVSA